jgi:hypothetical protein
MFSGFFRESIILFSAVLHFIDVSVLLIYVSRFQLYGLENIPRSPDQRRLSNVPMVGQDVPTAFEIASCEHF